MIRTGKAGKGTYGIVYTANMLGSNVQKVAVKRNLTNQSVSFSGSIKELDLLNRLKDHPYIVKLLSVNFGNPFMTPNSPLIGKEYTSFKEDYLYFIFEQADKSLHHVIHDPNIHISYLKLAMVQILLGVEYMHAKGVIHRDLKPANLLWFVKDNNSTVKICDFGLAKVNCTQTPSTPKVVTCWYRAPEICSKDPEYTYASDLWSVGCIFYEMLAKKALLQNYKDDDVKLLSRIIGLLSSSTKEDIDKLTLSRNIILNGQASPKSRTSLEALIALSPEKIQEFNTYPTEGASYEQFLNLLENLLVLNPDKRYTATQALSHPFFSPYKDIIEEVRREHIPEPILIPHISIIQCSERCWALKVAFKVFNSRENLAWYNHRIIFQSIDLFDRFIIHLHNTYSEQDYKVKSKYSGKYLSRYDTELRYVVCLYICIKYFTTLHIPISFESLVSDNYKTEKALIIAEDFEKQILSVMDYNIYRETVFEYADRVNHKLDEYNVRDMLARYGRMETIIDMSLTELYYIVRDMELPLSSSINNTSIAEIAINNLTTTISLANNVTQTLPIPFSTTL